MKIDVRNPDDGLRCHYARVFLNGEPLMDCVMADEEAGMVEVWRTNAHGQVKMYWNDTPPAPRTMIKRGAVTIEFIQ